MPSRLFSRQSPAAPGSEVSLGEVLEHGLLQLGLRQKLLEPGILLLQLSQPSGFLGLHPAVLLPPAVVGRLRHLDDAADVGDGLALGDQLLGGLELADDLLRCVPGAFHGRVPGPVWPDEDPHSPWTGCRGPRHRHKILLCYGSSSAMSETKEQPKGAGYIFDPLDERDKKSQLIDISDGLRTSVDLREWCSLVEDQGQLNSCTAHAAITLVEYFQRRAFGKHLDASRLFLYKVTRNLLGWTGDKGASSRATMKALALIGVPPECYWPYDEAKLDEEPSAFCYSIASRYRAIDYCRIDIKNRPREVVLQQVKASLAANRPVMFGMLFHQGCREQSRTTGMIPIPSDSDTKYFGHNMAAVGYDDSVKIRNKDSTELETTGALLVRNSWGEAWGEGGYGWLPYEYVLRQLSMDWWTMLKQEWLDTGEFEPKTT